MSRSFLGTPRKPFTAAFIILVIGTLLSSHPVAAKSRRPVVVKLPDCHDHTAFFPIPADQAQALLPSGFEAQGSPGEVQQVVNFYVSSYLCGVGGEQAFEMVTAYLAVDPGDAKAPEKSYYIVDAAAEGPDLSVLRKKLCLGDLLADGSIDITQQRAEPPLDLGSPQVGASVTSLDSEVLSVRTVVSAEGIAGPRTDVQRWYFGDGTRSLDTSNALRVWGIGSSSVTFTAPYRGLPTSGSGFSSQGVGDLTVAGSCKHAR
jgi:hypothetical protein